MTVTLGYATAVPGCGDLDEQLTQLAEAGVDPRRIFTDKTAGSADKMRAGLLALLSYARPGDVVVVAALLAGSLAAMLSALLIARAFGISGPVLASLAPKSTTAPVAIGIAERIGGRPTLTAALVLLTGIFGAIIATPLLNALHIRDWRARGFSVGVAAHGIGTARAFQVNETAGAFAGIGMGLNAVLTAILAPLVLHLFQ